MQGLNQTRNAIASESAVFNAHQTALTAQITKAKLDEEQARGQLREIDVQIESAQANLKMNQDILDRIAPLAAAGAIPQIQLMKQQQEVVRYQSQIDQAQAQKQRLALAIDKAQEVATATVATTQEETLTRISSNEKSLAELDTQANKAILENQKKIAEIDGQLQQAQLTMQYQELRALADGTVFELKPSSPGFVANSSTPLLKIVPSNGVIAKINITNKDIGFVKEGVPVDVRLDSFPFREFGDIKGILTSIGSDALPPDQIHQYYRFPAKVALAGQVLQVNGREVPLQSGMSVNVNIKLRKRSVMSILWNKC
jgi:HlyD family secretion protein